MSAKLRRCGVLPVDDCPDHGLADSSSGDEGPQIAGLDGRWSRTVNEAHERARIAREQMSVDLFGNQCPRDRICAADAVRNRRAGK